MRRELREGAKKPIFISWHMPQTKGIMETNSRQPSCGPWEGLKFLSASLALRTRRPGGIGDGYLTRARENQRLGQPSGRQQGFRLWLAVGGWTLVLFVDPVGGTKYRARKGLSEPEAVLPVDS